ncbi:MAG TPA: sigma-70 family RNA polymerase sigma factor [Pirellulales bacterium]|jgi:RNA polymerase sigma-70 factor (ECF subfamily)|nr:sigma-70 family RNA polymerase sigma factor [Pirellulales bacterium]
MSVAVVAAPVVSEATHAARNAAALCSREQPPFCSAPKELAWKENDCEQEAHDTSPPEFRLLIRAAAAGDREAQGWVLESCWQALLHAAQHLLPRDLQAKGDAWDLVQDTLLEAHRDFSRFQGYEQKELKAWLTHILRNNFYNWARAYRGCGKRQIAREVSLDDRAMTDLKEVLCVGSPSPSSAAILREEIFSGRRVLEQLPEKYRQVLFLRTGEGWSFKAIGAQFGCTAGAARKTWLRAIEQFRKECQ